MEYYLAPSILSADFSHLGDDIRAVKECGAKILHFDVMDGLFVPSISFGMPVLKSIRPLTDMFYDVHLMIRDRITVHAEACVHLDRVLDQIHDRGLKTGVALNPATPLHVLDYVYDKTDMILLMSVNPGFGGQKLIPAVLDKIAKLRGILDEKGLPAWIEVDGGINAKTIGSVIDAGANVFVAGSAVFGTGIETRYRELEALLPTE